MGSRRASEHQQAGKCHSRQRFTREISCRDVQVPIPFARLSSGACGTSLAELGRSRWSIYLAVWRAVYSKQNGTEPIGVSGLVSERIGRDFC